MPYMADRIHHTAWGLCVSEDDCAQKWRRRWTGKQPTYLDLSDAARVAGLAKAIGLLRLVYMLRAAGVLWNGWEGAVLNVLGM